MSNFGAVYGAIALWQAKRAQKHIARLRAEEAKLVRKATLQPTR
jgi:hypothetical protein